MTYNKNKVKAKFLFIFLVVLLSNRAFCQMASFKDIEIKSVSASTTSIVSVSCDHFDSTFSSEAFKIKYITDSATLESFRKILQRLKFRRREPEIDVRSKFYFHFVDKSATPLVVCASKFFDIVVNGKEIKKNKKGISEQKQLVYLLHKIKDGVN